MSLGRGNVEKIKPFASYLLPKSSADSARLNCLVAIGRYHQFDKPDHLDFIGRHDLQIKHNGYRLELEEVERLLQKNPRVN